MVKEMLYRKVGRKYEPVKEFEGFPADGIWMVSHNKHGRSERCLIFMEDIPEKPHPLITYSSFASELADYITAQWKDKLLSVQDIADLAAKFYAAKAVFGKESDFITKDV